MIPLRFNEKKFERQTVVVNGKRITYRAFLDLDYLMMPVAEEQQLNVFVPEPYFNQGKVNRYSRVTAPIFMPNTIGGYLPGPRDYPGNPAPYSRGATILQALARGYVVVSAGVRGRTTQNGGEFVGKAPAFIVDLKAAIRYIKFNAGWIPGDTEKIITNGTSAGGAASALAGASGNADFFAMRLTELGAAPATDDIFAASAYCPIHNLEHADAAYEWQFNGLNTWHSQQFSRVGNQLQVEPIAGKLSAKEQALSTQLKAAFPTYVNSLHLRNDQEAPLTLDDQGQGPFQQAIVNELKWSAQQVLDAGGDVAGQRGLTIQAGHVTRLDWSQYLRGLTRMKAVPAFDTLDLSSAETQLFGNRLLAARHFTSFAQKRSNVPAQQADPDLVTAINPVSYLGTNQSQVAQYWRIRHGAADRDTSFAIPFILATLLKNQGRDVDLAFPWGRPHDGDYDLPELFDWIDRICQ